MLRTWHKYDEHNRLTDQKWTLPNSSTYSTNYQYDGTGRLTRQQHVLPTGNSTITINYDTLSRIGTVNTTQHTRTYQYVAGSGTNTTTGLVSQLKLETTKSGGFSTKTYNYSYDNLGNISQINGPEGNISYTYDVQGQLTHVYDATNSNIWNYAYDTYGNIRRKEYMAGYATVELLTYSTGDGSMCSREKF